MKNLYELYTAAFPEYPVSEKKFSALLDGAAVFTRSEGEKITGFSVVRGQSVSLLCVRDAYRRRGIGSSLLDEAEAHIRKTGAENIVLGQGNGYILQGVPEEHSEAVPFFVNRGYTAERSSVNMFLDLHAFSCDALPIPPCPENVSFRTADACDTAALLEAVRSVNEKWVWYFEHNGDPVLLAVQDGHIVGFEMLCTKNIYFSFPGETIGSVGCVGVVKPARTRGIGRAMVAAGLEQLKASGCTRAELLYVYRTAWYEKIGFRQMHTQWMGKKDISI